MRAVWTTAAAILALTVGAESDCYRPREWNGRCSRDPYKLPSTLFGTKTTYPHATGLESKRAQRVYMRGDVKLMAKICSFEVAHYGWSPFCYLFDREDLDLFEYADDLDDYEKDVYGNKRSVAMGCVLVDELVDKIREKVQERLTGRPRANRRLISALYFTHAPVIKSLIGKLGLGRTEPPLTADNYCHYKYYRPWRSSHMVPFTANIALVLFECGHQGFYVLPLLNEKTIRLPGCRNEFCPISDFLRTRAVLSSRRCDLAKICSRNWNPNVGPE
ncbi:hypothetical protein V5799_014017 [Amblyomma americanum]|uniref:Multiple inositol polyphosphate phosphatase 1 n=1 Tax=Amblyomma americanum TaxID=6943 RepID=A0AAQ4E486_AMBAM